MIRNAKAVDAALGRSVLRGFCRCFVHANRLTSTISAIHASEQLYGRDNPGFERDLNSLVWFTIGTLRELARAIQEVRSALAKRKLLDPRSAPWVRLRELEDRWERDEFFRSKRDVAAFHVDSPVINKGLDEILKDEEDIELSRGIGRKSVESMLSLGITSLHNGLDMSLEQYKAFLTVVSEDHGISETIQEAFIQALRDVGIPFGDE